MVSNSGGRVGDSGLSNDLGIYWLLAFFCIIVNGNTYVSTGENMFLSGDRT
jgi:hypothetical protein